MRYHFLAILLIILSSFLLEAKESFKINPQKLFQRVMENYWKHPSLKAEVVKTIQLELLEETKKVKGVFHISKGSVSLKTHNQDSSQKDLFILRNKHIFIGKKTKSNSQWKIYRFKRNKKKDHFLNTLFSKNDLKQHLKVTSLKSTTKGWILQIKSIDHTFKNIEIEIGKKKPLFITRISWKDSIDNKSTINFSKLKILKTPLTDKIFSLPKNSVVDSL